MDKYLIHLNKTDIRNEAVISKETSNKQNLSKVVFVKDSTEKEKMDKNNTPKTESCFSNTNNSNASRKRKLCGSMKK